MESDKRPSINFNLNPDQISQLVDELISSKKSVDDKIASIPKSERTWENTVLAFEYNKAQASTRAIEAVFPQYVSTIKEVREASTKAKTKLEQADIDTYMREDLYNALLEYKEKNEQRDSLDQRLLNKILESFERNGLKLDKEKRKRLEEAKKKMASLASEASKNMNEETAKFSFTEAELDGVKENFLNGLPKDSDGKRVVSLKYPDYIPVMKYCKVENTRSILEEAFSGRCQKENIPILEELIKLRRDCAHLLDFPDHASYVLAIRMAKNPKIVGAFLDDLIERFEEQIQKDYNKLLELKKKDCQERCFYFDGTINPYDSAFYQNILVETEYKVNDSEVQEYFPLEQVTKGLLDVYQELLGLKFKKVENPSVWHSDVDLIEVFDSENDKYIGQFYLDLFPRDGKFTHAAVFPINQCYRKQDGSWQYPVAAMVANFTKPTSEQPSFLEHDEVVTFFHEMGHVFHNVCSLSKYFTFAGTKVERDFVEAPSQMLENWCWEKDILKRMSKHKVSKEPLPDDLLEKMVKSKLANSGLFYRRQLFFGKYDQKIHTEEDLPDLGELYASMKEKITIVKQTPGTNGAGSWGHIFEGYDASYYGYLWSEVYSSDMFDQFKTKGNVMDKELGKRYRSVILENGGSKDGGDLIREFLGREPNNEAFLKHLGLKK